MKKMIISGSTRRHTWPVRLQVITRTRARVPGAAPPDRAVKLHHPAFIWGCVLVLIAIGITLVTVVLAVGLTLLALIGVLTLSMSVVAAIVTRVMRQRRWRSPPA
jgi:Flp pilus assembly protein TadB